ncbi:uncharacterized protein C1orf131 homolog isoform X1 [Dunckerocampus dactyliophorus]|uniref:uncharacterized protein C1orf131 homolog isoform X1 n=1 Tax=Dunckerocampus dactyliophorus TaxID=161453 RepID=UPI0024070D28|nr:uncharacterized protein C1orf131 homolog isoform X1 [Dunckerocampus dactyliophorus]XP_054616931.1 uncharacterized protein C1orf131 homolog isoform X1 [Dunckerocampus dactyliophorus]XP_054616932.1 uncharacterized protein C1orf131 homolog isoform X1 [Dunckerocampus dactyliophorus]
MNPKVNKDDDCVFLEQVLDTLYDFGSGTRSKTRKKKQKSCEEEEVPEGDVNVCGVVEEHPSEMNNTVQCDATIKPVRQVEVVTFQDPSKKKKKTKESPAADGTSLPQTSEKKQIGPHGDLDLEKARLEVHRFGITGYKKEQQRVFEQERAIMLGAHPPTKDYVNYKVLQQQIKDKKKKAREEAQPDLKRKKKSQSRDKKTTSGSSSAPTGQVGRFKNGMLILSPKEIQTIKGKRGGK